MSKLATTRIDALVLLSLLLLTLAGAFCLMPVAEAETKVISISPASGYVGTNVTLRVNLSVLGPYKILFDGKEIPEIPGGVATENSITVHFTVPPAPQGAHTVTIISANDEEDTVSFNVQEYQSFKPNVPAAPTQFQQGESVTITVNITGGLANHVYPKIKVQTPREDLNYTLRNNIDIATDAEGTCLMNITYPDDFSTGANTNFTGYYRIFFNETLVDQFFIGITNASVYHRGDVVNIKAVGYPINENVTVTIRFGEDPIHVASCIAEDGVINYDWLVKDDLQVSNSTHTYSVAISPISTVKNFSDTQTFKIPGFRTMIYTRNLAGKLVPGILIEIYDESARIHYTNVSGTDGHACFNLEKGNYTINAFIKDVKVLHSLQFGVKGESSLNVTCQLTSLIIKVENEQGVPIPHAAINIAYNYTTNYGISENRFGVEAANSDINGTATFTAMLPGVDYQVNASLYGVIFNVNNGTIHNLPAAEYVRVTILCPTRRLHIQVLDANNKPIPSATVKTSELTAGIFVEGQVSNGNAILPCIFGKHSVKVFVNEILLNETIVDLTSNMPDIEETIKCELYGLTIQVKVVDCLGQPIPGVNTMLLRGNLQFSNRTDLNGIATFSEAIGGEVTLAIYPPASSEPFFRKLVCVENSTTLTVKAAKYVVLLGFLFETSHVVTIIIVVLTALCVIFAEAYLRGWLVHRQRASQKV